ncbi:unnamed protein product [Prorocentrum cordatum]|nr:unnamed protein product [Polarella glacialis]
MQIHMHGLAHGDLSLENVLLAEEGGGPQAVDIRLIDFGCSTGPAASGLRGKPSYQAPELHLEAEYDAFAVDAFSLGVMIFTVVVGNYPWSSTRPSAGGCQVFQFYAEKGLTAYLQRRRIRVDNQVVVLSDVLSPSLTDLLAGLLAVNSSNRLTVAGACKHSWLAAP